MRICRFPHLLFSLSLFTALAPLTTEASFQSKVCICILAMLVHANQKGSTEQNTEQNLAYLPYEQQYITPFTEDQHLLDEREVHHLERRGLQGIDDIECDCRCTDSYLDLLTFFTAIILQIWGCCLLWRKEEEKSNQAAIVARQNPVPPQVDKNEEENLIVEETVFIARSSIA